MENLSQVNVCQSRNGLIAVGVVTAVITLVSLMPLTLVVASFRAGYPKLCLLFLSMVVLLGFMTNMLARGFIKGLRNRGRPVLVFDTDGFSYFSNDFSEQEYVAYKDICKVHKPDKNYRQDCLNVSKKSGTECIIVINSLELSSKEVFAILKDRCPQLQQPYSTVQMLS
jgi:hypothetical protein